MRRERLLGLHQLLDPHFEALLALELRRFESCKLGDRPAVGVALPHNFVELQAEAFGPCFAAAAERVPISQPMTAPTSSAIRPNTTPAASNDRTSPEQNANF